MNSNIDTRKQINMSSLCEKQNKSSFDLKSDILG